MSKPGEAPILQLLGGDVVQDIELPKRFYMPYVVKAKCPDCGELCEVNLTENYLSYPCVDCVEPVHMVCGSDHEFHVDVIVRLGLELAPVDG